MNDMELSETDTNPNSNETLMKELELQKSNESLANELELQTQLRKQEKLEAKRLAEEEALKKRKETALKGMKYLLGISQKYSTFFKEKISQENFKKPLQERKNKLQPTLNDMKEAVHEKNRKSKDKSFADVSKFLKYFEGGSLHPYQLDGVIWMTVLFENGLNGILADEMGLGKTIQVIALICHLLERQTEGPFLIVAPLSTVPNWQSEFKRFAPQVPVVVFHGSEYERISQYKKINQKHAIGSFHTRPVVITTYQVPLREHKFLTRFEWQYIIVDEGHRIKNHESKLAKILRSMDSSNRLLLTGTPLQNNITELWALLNFLLPHIFNNVDTFASLLMIEDVQDENKILEQEEKNNLISTIHKVLAPFMLRRLKKDVLTNMVPKKEVNVYCPLSKLQRDLYSYVINHNIAKLRRLDDDDDEDTLAILNQPKKKRKCVIEREKQANTSKTDQLNDSDLDDSDFEDNLIAEKEIKTVLGEKFEKEVVPYITRLTMQNTMIMFKKIVDHPYLVNFPLDPKIDTPSLLINEDLIRSSGKMLVLDAMLPKLQNMGHKVLIFSTLVMTLDLVEEFLIMRKYKYTRLDGADSLERRAINITQFNNNPDVFIFLISTKAGGLGLNLSSADTVIFFDRDWNPQNDIQAQDRCHRIGQTRPVMVYTLVTKNTIDEKIITCGEQKRLLEKIVIKDGKFKTLNHDDKLKVENELQELQELLDRESRSHSIVFSKTELDKLLDRSELYEQMNNNSLDVSIKRKR